MFNPNVYFLQSTEYRDSTPENTPVLDWKQSITVPAIEVPCIKSWVCITLDTEYLYFFYASMCGSIGFDPGDVSTYVLSMYLI